MRTHSYLVIAVLTMGGTLHAQIPNNGFEGWRTVNQALEPASWYSLYSPMDSSGSDAPVSRSRDHYPSSIGSYSVRIANDTSRWKQATPPASFLGWGILTSGAANDRPLFAIQGHPLSLRGCYKFLPANDDTMNMVVFLHLNGSEVARGQFQSTAPQAAWTSFAAVISTYANADSARITLSAANEPKEGKTGPRGNSVLWIDNLSFDSLIVSGVEPGDQAIPSSAELMQNYPNPFNSETVIGYRVAGIGD